MGTSIEWATHTWNPVVGCSTVSDGCTNCYAAAVASRQMQPAHEGLTIGRRWNGTVRLLPERLEEPLRWRKPRRVFVGSMTDLFHPAVPDGFLVAIWEVMRQTPQHTYQVLTKRPQRMAAWVQRWHDITGEDFVPKLARGPEATRAAHPSPKGQLWADYLDQLGPPPEGCAYPTFDWMEGPLRMLPCEPLPNVWLGTSIESDRYTWRADHLRATPAAVRFISAEPLLGPLPSLDLTGIDWLIVGGESGPGARPMHPDWVRDLRDRCALPDLNDCWSSPEGRGDRHTAFLFKQAGSVLGREWGCSDHKGGDITAWPEDLRIREYPR